PLPRVSPFFVLRSRPPPCPTPFPYTTLFRSLGDVRVVPQHPHAQGHGPAGHLCPHPAQADDAQRLFRHLHPHEPGPLPALVHREDRKSTRLNSSHVKISYAVFCLKKKNKKSK